MDYNPPPLIRPVPPPPPRRGRGWMILSLVLMVVLGLVLLNSVAGALLGFGGGPVGRQSGRHLDEVVVENNGSLDKIAIVDVEGIITSQAWDRSGRSMVDLIEDQLRKAARDDRVKAVILKVDSPGGEVMASDNIARTLREFQTGERKPIIVSMEGLAASGGYYIAAPCRWIVANELTITGSIGVIMHSINYRGLLDKVGVQPMTFKSGRFKDMLSGTKKPEEIDPAEVAMIQNMIDETHRKFKQVVAEGRKWSNDLNGSEGRPLAEDWEQYADGRILTGQTAYEHGFVDQLGTFQTAVEKAMEIAGIPQANLIRYQEPFSFSDMFRLFGSGSDKVQIQLNLGLQTPKLEAGRMYFLSRSLVH